MDLLHKQFVFSGLIARTILYAIQQGYMVTLGEAYRPAETAEVYFERGSGIKQSLHTKRLAMDLNLFRGDVFLTTKSEYQFLGDFWESLSEPNSGIVCCWGGNFKTADADHFSIMESGVK